jgi:hypothetical protein
MRKDGMSRGDANPTARFAAARRVRRQLQELQSVDRVYGKAGGRLEVCDECGAVLDSTVLDVEPHLAECTRREEN